MTSSNIRVRFAPSPTGLLHVGNARTALFNWLFAKKMQGSFILKIDDTDTQRSTKEYEVTLLKDLLWLGISWDEGPDIGGSYGPYRQSERGNLYETYAGELVEKGLAYPCFCTSDELDIMRKEQMSKKIPPGYTGKCFSLSSDERNSYLKENKPHAIRFRIGQSNHTIQFTDLSKGVISFKNTSLKDFVILRSDKIASYNFAAVIDDALMAISHVIRGDDHLPNVPKQLLIYKALGFTPPQFAHLPMILGSESKPLSKRSEEISIGNLKKQGFLKETIINAIALLGWSPDDKKEILSNEELIRTFSLEKVAKGHAVFDQKKFKWINKQYLYNYSTKKLLPLIIPYISSAGINVEAIPQEKLLAITSVLKENIETLYQVTDLIDIFFGNDITFTPFALSFLNSKEAKEIIVTLKKIIEEHNNSDTLYNDTVKQLKKMGIKGKSLFMPVRIAVTGQTKGPELNKIFKIVGKDILLTRIDKTLVHLHSIQDEH